MRRAVPLVWTALGLCCAWTACDEGEAGAEGDVEVVGTATPITIDGLFDDWADVPVAWSDPAGDAGTSGADLLELKVTNDDRYLFLWIELSEELALDEENALTLFIDADDDADSGLGAHGLGAELQWVFGERTGTFSGQGGDQEIGFSDIRFRALPTVSSPAFEMAIGRDQKPDGATTLLPESEIVLLLQDRAQDEPGLIDGDLAPDEGRRLLYSFDDTALAPTEVLPLERTEADTVRIVTYNVLWDGISEPGREDSFRRILTALDPDVIALQEVTNHDPVHERIEAWLPIEDGAWHRLSFGNNVTFSRHPFVTSWPPTYDPIDDRIAVSPIELPGGGWIVLFNAHLSCCEAESERQWEADSFAAYLRDIVAPDGVMGLPRDTPMILVGDLNLVQGSQPLRTLVTGQMVHEAYYGPSGAPDWDGTDLADLVSRQTEQRMAYTWRSDGGGHWPGRLDFHIYTDSVLSVAHHFVLHTGEMSAEELQSRGLEAGDCANASDHLPHVADYRLTP